MPDEESFERERERIRTDLHVEFELRAMKEELGELKELCRGEMEDRVGKLEDRVGKLEFKLSTLRQRQKASVGEIAVKTGWTGVAWKAVGKMFRWW